MLEAWGAQGGGLNDSGGKGGYSVGIINLNEEDVLYITVGQKGPTGGTGSMSFGGGWLLLDKQF